MCTNKESSVWLQDPWILNPCVFTTRDWRTIALVFVCYCHMQTCHSFAVHSFENGSLILAMSRDTSFLYKAIVEDSLLFNDCSSYMKLHILSCIFWPREVIKRFVRSSANKLIKALIVWLYIQGEQPISAMLWHMNIIVVNWWTFLNST